jgi:tight adherence protein B
MTFSRDDAARLCGQVSALCRAGLPPARVWAVLAENEGPSSAVALTVAGMLAIGGSAGDGLRLAGGELRGSGVEALAWLAVTADVIERSGAPAAVVFDGVGESLLHQIAQADEEEVALAGPRATAAVLNILPLAGMLLGVAMGLNPVGVLLGTPAGWACSLAGGLLWIAGRRWTSGLVAAASKAAG